MSGVDGTLTLYNAGLHGVALPVVVRSGFGKGVWCSGIAESAVSEAVCVSPCRTFLSGSSPLRSRDLQVDLSSSMVTKDLVAALVFLSVSDCSPVLFVMLTDSAIANDGSGTFLRARPVDWSSVTILSWGSAGHYCERPMTRLPSEAAMSLRQLNASLPAQVGEMLIRLGALLLPGQHPLFIVRSLVLAVLLCTGLTASGSAIADTPGPRAAGASEDVLGCSPRLLPLIWVARSCGYLELWTALAGSTTSVGSKLLDWLKELCRDSQDHWASDLRSIRSAGYAGKDLPLPDICAALKLDDYDSACTIAGHLGALWQDVYESTCVWLSDVKDLPYAQASDLARTFTSADSAKTPQLVLGGYYLGGAGPDSARGNICRILSPSKTRLDKDLWEKVFGSQHLLSLDYGGFWKAGCAMPAGPLDGGSFGSGTFFGSAAPSALSGFNMADAVI